MPEEARTQRENPEEPLWGWPEELLAQLIEEVSILAADKRRKENRTVPRPFAIEAPAENAGGLVENAEGGMTAHGHDAMLQMFRSHVGRPVAPPAPAPAEAAPEASDGGPPPVQGATDE